VGHRIAIHDADRPMKDIHWNESDRVITRKAGFKFNTVRQELDGLLDKAGLKGMEIVMSRSLYANPLPPKPKPKPKPDKRYSRTSFTLTCKNSYYSYKLSDHWEITPKRVATDKDPFVIMSFFKAHRFEDYYGFGKGFYTMYRDDVKLAKKFGLVMPKVYGHKSTARKTLRYKDVIGTPYWKWRIEFFAQAVDAEMQRLIKYRSRKKHLGQLFTRTMDQKSLSRLTLSLGLRHPIVKLATRDFKARRALRRLDKTGSKPVRFTTEDLDSLAKMGVIHDSEEESDIALAKVVKSDYPLVFTRSICFGVLTHTESVHWKHWVHYVRLMDKERVQREVQHDRGQHLGSSPRQADQRESGDGKLPVAEASAEVKELGQGQEASDSAGRNPELDPQGIRAPREGVVVQGQEASAGSEHSNPGNGHEERGPISVDEVLGKVDEQSVLAISEAAVHLPEAQEHPSG
jgi:hypothetical protein